MKTKDFILIGLSMVVIFLLVKPEEVSNPYYLREMKASKKRQDSLVNELNELKTPRHEIKDSIQTTDSIYIAIDKPQARERANGLFERFDIR